MRLNELRRSATVQSVCCRQPVKQSISKQHLENIIVEKGSGKQDGENRPWKKPHVTLHPTRAHNAEAQSEWDIGAEYSGDVINGALVLFHVVIVALVVPVHANA